MSGCPFSSPQNLFADLADAREKKIVYNERLGGYLVTKYEDIKFVLDHPEVFSSRPTVPEFPPPVREIFEGKVPGKGTLLGWDNPDHDRLRKSVASFFVPRRLQRFEGEMARIAHQLVDGFADQGEADIKRVFALPLPLMMIATVAGLDPSRWQWIGRSLALFGGHSEFADGTIEQKVQGILDIHEYVADLIQQRKTDRRDDLISHIWNERDSGNVTMTDMEHLAMIPGLLLAGHETTTNVLSMGLSHLLERGLWDIANVDDQARSNTIEELVRFESAITGMKRLALVDTIVAGHSIKAGELLWVAYNSGSRDPTKFVNPDQLNITRKSSTQHFGFGRGIHACLGAPLARLLLRVELDVLYTRLPDLKLAMDYNAIEYLPISEGRGVHAVQVHWDASRVKVREVSALIASKQIQAQQSSGDLNVVVKDAQMIAQSVLQLTLAKSDGTKLPSWTPGAHIDVRIGTLGYRQYSICTEDQASDHLDIAVLLQKTGLGGSSYIHKHFQQGHHIRIRNPRNHFQLEQARQYIFIAGGIGITPMRAMLQAAKAAGAVYKLIYLGSSRKNMPWATELCQAHPTTLWPKDKKGRFDITRVIPNSPKDAQDLLIYCCGPERLMQAVETACAHLPPSTLRVERFAALEADASTNEAFEVVMKRSGRTIPVPADRSLLDVLNENGAGIMSTCTKGTCGTCEIGVLEGTPLHRDTVLTRTEKLDKKSMIPCVSRCIGKSITLDLW